MRCVSIAICTCGEPVSASLRPCFVMISCLASLVRATALSFLSPPEAPPAAPRSVDASRAWVAGRVAETGMESAIPQKRLGEVVLDAQARTGVSVAAAALHVDGRTTFAGAYERPFRIASITKSFTATAVSLAGLLDDRRRTLLSHTAGYRPERAEPLPPECAGLWSYSNAGYWEAASGFEGEYSDALRELVLDPLGLHHTG